MDNGMTQTSNGVMAERNGAGHVERANSGDEAKTLSGRPRRAHRPMRSPKCR